MLSSQPLPAWALVAVAVAAAGVGLLTSRVLATAGYRVEGDRDDGPPHAPWWPVVGLPALALYAAWHIGTAAHWAALPAYLLFAWLTVAFIWIDIDVHRLPNGLVYPAVPLLAVGLVLASLGEGSMRGVRGALIGALVVGILFVILGLLPGGGVGMGDIKLAPLVGALLGWMGGGAILVGVIATFLIGGLSAAVLLLLRRVGLKSHIAYGPAMCLGVFVAMGFTSQILTGLLAR